jgi:hypothetical protein
VKLGCYGDALIVAHARVVSAKQAPGNFHRSSSSFYRLSFSHRPPAFSRVYGFQRAIKYWTQHWFLNTRKRAKRLTFSVGKRARIIACTTTHTLFSNLNEAQLGNERQAADTCWTHRIQHSQAETGTNRAESHSTRYTAIVTHYFISQQKRNSICKAHAHTTT